MSLIGKRLADRYEVVAELGRGGMGVVYRARDPLLERDVAVKAVSAGEMSAETQERFLREARIAAQLDHPAIVGAYDFGKHEDLMFFVMPLVEGRSLRDFMNDGVLPLADVVEIGIQAADALEYSHSKGVVHRDVKPENIMVAQEAGATRVRVTDFGLAIATTHQRLTGSGLLVGTVCYLSPEQITRGPIDARSDIYSLGTVLYECVTGVAPFTGDTGSVLYRIVRDEPVPPQTLGFDIDERVQELIMRCLEKEPARRPQRSREIAVELAQCRGTVSQTASVRQRLSSSPTSRAARPRLSAFVGRGREFAELQRRLNAAVAGACQLVLVAGEAGVGKTRLLEELRALARARGIAVVSGRFIEQDRSFPYQGFCDLIQEHFRSRPQGGAEGGLAELAPDLVALFPALGEIAELRAAAQAGAASAARSPSWRAEDRTHVFELLARTLARIAADRPLVVLLEELHEAEVSVEAIEYLLRRLAPSPILIAASYRASEIDRRHPLARLMVGLRGEPRATTMALEPFTREEQARLVEHLLGCAAERLDADFLARLYEATEGNAYFASELVRALVDSGRLATAASGVWRLAAGGVFTEALPATIQQTVERRLERLPEELREALAAASVLGTVLEPRDLAPLVGGEENAERAVDSLVDLGFLENRDARGDTVAFPSGVVRDVVYARLPRRKRRSLHRAAGEHLERRHAARLARIYPQLVRHFAEADDADRVALYGMAQARAALASYAADEAVHAARQVLEFASDGEAGERAEREARGVLAAAHRMNGDAEAAIAELDAAAALAARGNDAAGRVAALAAAAETAWEARRTVEARTRAEAAIEVARDAGAGSSDALARLLALAATLANLRGDGERARAHLEEAARLAPPVDAGETPRGGTLAVGLAVQVRATTPEEIRLDEEAEILANVFETLVENDRDGSLQPVLCERWEVLDGGRSFAFTLRPEARLHDGRAIDAAMVIAAVERTVRAAGDATPAAFAALAGCADFLAGRSASIAGLVAHAARTVRMDLTECFPTFPALLADTRAAIAAAPLGIEAGSGPVGSGPFRLGETQAPRRMTLVRAEPYWRGETALVDRVEFRHGLPAAELAAALRSGEIDVARDLPPAEMEALSRDRRLRTTLLEAPRCTLHFALFRAGSAHVAAAMRQAMCGVVHTRDLVRQALGRSADPAEGLFPPGILGHDAERRRAPLTTERVRELVGEANISPPLRLRALLHPVLADRYGALVERLLETWRSIGVEVELQLGVADAAVDGNQEERADLLLGRWVADYADPDDFAYGLFHSSAGIFRHWFSSPETDRLAERGRAEPLARERERIYREFEQVVVGGCRLLPLFHDIDERLALGLGGATLKSTPPYFGYAQAWKTAPEAAPRARAAGGALEVPFGAELRSLDPALAFLEVQAETLPAIFETLTREGRGSGFAPWLANEVRSEAGGRRWVFRLREGVRFHDGRRLTARDVRWSFERLLRNPAAENRWLVGAVAGAAAVMAGERADLAGFQIRSAGEFAITLEEPLSFFPVLLSFPCTAILPEGTEQLGGSWGEGCVGTGPFRVERFDPGRRLELAANPQYWRPEYPRSERLAFSFGVAPEQVLADFRSGRFALAWGLFPADIEALRREGEIGAGYRETPRLSTYYVAYNINRGPLADVAVRRRLVAALDPERLVREAAGRLAVPAHGFIPPGLLGSEPLRRPAAAPRDSWRGEPIELTAVVNSVYEGPYAAVAAAIFAALAESGFVVRVVDPRSEYAGNQAEALGSVDLALTRWIADFPDPDTFAALLDTRTGVVGRLCGSPEIDALLARGRSEPDAAARHAVYREIENAIADGVLLTPLFHEKSYCFARPELESFDLQFFSPIVPFEKLALRPF